MQKEKENQTQRKEAKGIIRGERHHQTNEAVDCAVWTFPGLCFQNSLHRPLVLLPRQFLYCSWHNYPVPSGFWKYPEMVTGEFGWEGLKACVREKVTLFALCMAWLTWEPGGLGSGLSHTVVLVSERQTRSLSRCGVPECGTVRSNLAALLNHLGFFLECSSPMLLLVQAPLCLSWEGLGFRKHKPKSQIILGLNFSTKHIPGYMSLSRPLNLSKLVTVSVGIGQITLPIYRVLG